MSPAPAPSHPGHSLNIKPERTNIFFKLMAVSASAWRADYAKRA